MSKSLQDKECISRSLAYSGVNNSLPMLANNLVDNKVIADNIDILLTNSVATTNMWCDSSATVLKDPLAGDTKLHDSSTVLINSGLANDGLTISMSLPYIVCLLTL